jgi:endonuclease/exonuclease/phosphatase (EEP) superfamily protein YafD
MKITQLTIDSATRRPWTRARVLDTSAWGWTALAGAVAISQIVGYTGFPVLYVLQALTPFTLAPSLPLALIASRAGRHRMAIVNALVVATLLWLSIPVVFHGTPPAVADGVPRLTIGFANAYFGNAHADDAAASLLASEPDVISIAEYPRQLERALADRGAFDSYPYRIGRTETDRGGIALLSRYPFTFSSYESSGNQPSIEVVLDMHGTSVRIFVVHPLTGTDPGSLEKWESDLHSIQGRIDTPGPPTVVVGDFNASRWHPAFRDLLDDSGYRDVHEWFGHGLSTSWPADVVIPPFVRIDHALVGDGAVPVSIHDVDIPGSDHLGFVVTLAITG